ncbi:MAG: FMN-binding protein [Actinobacteria bacterium]|nr:FMN-binding protein [Actinomycetota bacterium]
MAATRSPFDSPLPAQPPVAPAVGDPQGERLARLAARSGDGTSRRRAHPSKTARTVALVSSVVATAGVAAAMASADGAATTDGTAATAVVPASSTGSSATGSSKGTSTALYADGTWTGAAEWTRWGYVQVQVTVKNGKLSDVTALQSPNDGRSRSINSRAQPVLEQEAIAAQSADIDMVSGATYTSRTYSASLQAALDKAAQAVTTARTGQS